MTQARSGRAAARDLGERLSLGVTDPAAFERQLDHGLRRLARNQRPTGGSARAARSPQTIEIPPSLLRAIARPVVRTLTEGSPAVALYLAQQLSRSAAPEARFLAIPILGQSLAADPERTWQLIRGLGRAATDRPTVDALAGLVAVGIAAEPYRWAELEQLVYAASPVERRLVGSALIVLARDPGEQADRALALVGQLMGDADPAVQQALAGAIRAWTRSAPTAAGPFWAKETEAAVSGADGHRARVLRLASPALAPDARSALRARLAGLRSRHLDPSTSRAHEAAAAFVRTGYLRSPGPNGSARTGGTGGTGFSGARPPDPPLESAATTGSRWSGWSQAR